MSNTQMSVAVGLIFNKDTILLGKRTSGYYTGYWEFPGGKIEHNETSQTAVYREIQEELAVTVTDAKEIMTIKHALHVSTLMLYIWQINTYEGKVIPNEQQQLQWAPISELKKIKTIPTNAPIIDYIVQTFEMSTQPL